MELYEQATKEVRTAGILMSEFRMKSSRSDISVNFDFAEKWRRAFPKSTDKSYEHGSEIVKAGAKIAGINQTTIYYALRTTAVYSRKEYETLDAKAQENGAVLCWTHLRIIAERLADNAEVRAEIEAALVSRRLTTAELNDLIDEALGETNTPEEQTALQAFEETINAFKAFAGSTGRFVAVFEAVENTFDGSEEQKKEVLERAYELLGYFGDIQEFLEEHEASIQKICDAVQGETENADAEDEEEMLAELGVA